MLRKLSRVSPLFAFCFANFQKIAQGSPDLYPPPTLHIECGSGSGKDNECGSMRIRIHSPGYRVPDAFKFLSRSGSGIPKMSMRIRIHKGKIRKIKKILLFSNNV